MRALLLLLAVVLPLCAQWPRAGAAAPPAAEPPASDRPAPPAGDESAAVQAAEPRPADEAAPMFRSSSALVRIDTLVASRRGVIAGLQPGDFIVLDEGTPAPLEWFGVETSPLRVALLFDVSGSMSKMLADMAAVATRALSALGRQDQVAVIVFGRKIVPLLDCTTDLRAAARIVQEAPLEREVGAGTNLNGAILETIDWLQHQPRFDGRQVLVVLTDNRGMHYQTPDDKVLRALAASDITLNAIVPPGAKPPGVRGDPAANADFTPPDIFKLARETGGEVLRADRAGTRFIEMMERVRSRYDLVIRARPEPVARFRHLEVRLSPAAVARLGKVEVRARSGYYAPEAAP